MINSYQKYKTSGVSWMDKIPTHWKIIRLKFLFKVIKDISGELGYNVLSVTQKGIKIKDLSSNEGQHSMDYSKYQFVKEGQFVMNHMDLLTGFIDISKFNGVTSPDYRVFEKINDQLNDNYYLYIFQSCYWNKIFYGLGQGVSTLGRWRLPSDVFNDFLLPVPSLSEQNAIVKYLDSKTNLIDRLIFLSEKKIESLNEKKTFLINQVVTKGLNPVVEMKDSGVEWIGKIPKHWKRTSVKRIVSTKLCDGPHTTPKFIDKGVPFISVESIKNEKINFDYVRGYISKEDDLEFSKKTKPQRDDILLVKSGSTTGKVTIVETDMDFNIWSPLCLIRANIGIVFPRFVFYMMRSEYFQLSIQQSWSFGTQPNIGMGVIENIILVIPPIPEQKKIIDHIEGQTQELEMLIKLEKNKIELLKRYRQSLITEVVTGKIKVLEHEPERTAV
jgi:type I restriction enzyme S subunit